MMRRLRRWLRLGAVLSGMGGTVIEGLYGFPLTMNNPMRWFQTPSQRVFKWVGFLLLVFGFLLAGWAEIRSFRMRRALSKRGEESA